MLRLFNAQKSYSKGKQILEYAFFIYNIKFCWVFCTYRIHISILGLRNAYINLYFFWNLQFIVLDFFIVFKSRHYKKTKKNIIFRANVTYRPNIALSRLLDSSNSSFKTLCCVWLMCRKIWSPLSLGKYLHRYRKSFVVYHIPYFHLALFSLCFCFHH